MTTVTPLQTTYAVRTLYRSLLREVNKLPYGYLRVFFRLKFRDDICSNPTHSTRTIELSAAKKRRLEREVRRMEDANSGNKKAVVRVLDLAYGRKGKLKRELMEPHLSTAGAEKPDPLIRDVESSRPPTYTPKLIALLTSPTSRSNKPLSEKHIGSPPILPPRADPKSKEAQLLGPFSKRRKVNLLWRYFASQKQKVIPPLEVTIRSVKQSKASNSDYVEVSESSRRSDVLAKGFTEGGFQGVGLLQEIQRLAGVRDKHRTPARREWRMLSTDGIDSGATSGEVSENTSLPTKFLRRRHQELLRKIPILTWSEHSTSGQSGDMKGRYEVSLPSGAMAPPSSLPSAQTLPMARGCNLAWIQRAQVIDKQKHHSKK